MSVQDKYTSKVIKEIFGDTNPRSPNYDSRPDEEREARVSEEVERLMSNPHELQYDDLESKVSIDVINKMVAKNGANFVQFGIDVYQYYRKLATEQAEDTI